MRRRLPLTWGLAGIRRAQRPPTGQTHGPRGESKWTSMSGRSSRPGASPMSGLEPLEAEPVAAGTRRAPLMTRGARRQGRWRRTVRNPDPRKLGQEGESRQLGQAARRRRHRAALPARLSAVPKGRRMSWSGPGTGGGKHGQAPGHTLSRAIRFRSSKVDMWTRARRGVDQAGTPSQMGLYPTREDAEGHKEGKKEGGAGRAKSMWKGPSRSGWGSGAQMCPGRAALVPDRAWK